MCMSKRTSNAFKFIYDLRQRRLSHYNFIITYSVDIFHPIYRERKKVSLLLHKKKHLQTRVLIRETCFKILLFVYMHTHTHKYVAVSAKLLQKENMWFAW